MFNKPHPALSDHEKIREVKNLFSRITPNYDRLNHLLSARRDISWRKFAVKRLPKNAEIILDIATGTGDIALETAKLNKNVKVIGLDFATEMMKLAINKTALRNLSGRITYISGDALRLPFPSGLFDAAVMAFGLRNIPDKLAALKEMARVVKPGGKVIILEMTFFRNIRIKKIFHWYLNNIVPLVGGFISRDKTAYRYLSDSIWDFIQPQELTVLFQKSNLNNIRAFPLSCGITYLHEGIV